MIGFLKTLKTALGYLVTLIDKYSPTRFSNPSLTRIFNYLPINEQLTTSGQPTEQQFANIAAAGFKTVINLAPHGAENSLPNEQQTVTDLGMSYSHIPVNFYHPSQRRFWMFVEAMQQAEHTNQKVWLHCAANMRVSAFVYCYRCAVLKQDPELAKKDLSKVWEPIAVWKKFIAQTTQQTVQ